MGRRDRDLHRPRRPGRPVRRRRHHRPRRQLLHHGGGHAVHRLLRLPAARRRRHRRSDAALAAAGVGGVRGHRRRRRRRRRALRHPAVPRPHGDRAGAVRAVPARRRGAGHGARAPGCSSARSRRSSRSASSPRSRARSRSCSRRGRLPGRCAGCGPASPCSCCSRRWAHSRRARRGASGAAISSKTALGYVPGGPGELGGTWNAAMPDYSTPGIGNPLRRATCSPAIVGVALVVGVTWGSAAVPLAPATGVRRSPARRDPALAIGDAAPARGPLARAQDRRHRRRAPSPTSSRTRSSPPRPRTAAAPRSAHQARDARALRGRREPRALHLDAARARRRSRWSSPPRPGCRVRSFSRKVWLSAGLLALFIALPVGALVVHARAPWSSRSGRFTFTEPGSARRRYARDPRRGRRRLRPAHHLDDALVGPPARPHRAPLARRRGRHARR